MYKIASADKRPFRYIYHRQGDKDIPDLDLHGVPVVAVEVPYREVLLYLLEQQCPNLKKWTLSTLKLFHMALETD